MKNYVKPELFYERYELSQHIADCAWEYQNFNTKGCDLVADFDQTGLIGTLFTAEEGCSLDSNKNGFEDYCYQNSADMNNTFVS